MHRRHVQPTKRESPFGIDELFFSTTDSRGVITDGNEIFVRVSGFELSELLGVPHNCIRHPHMPRSVFRLLWRFLKANKPIVAYVKNMSKNGDYYWVVALATPIPSGYLSIRFKPSTPIVSVVSELYQKMLRAEERAEDRMSEAAMDESERLLVLALAELGFSSYDEFMHHVLSEELKNREQQMKAAGLESNDNVAKIPHKLGAAANAVKNEIEQIFGALDSFVQVQKLLASKTTFISNITKTITTLSLNAHVEASRLGDKGKTLSVLSQYLDDSSASIRTDSRELAASFSYCVHDINAAVFNFAAAKLQIEMFINFMREVTAHSDSEKYCEQSDRRMSELWGALGDFLSRALMALESVREKLPELISQNDLLHRSVQLLRFVYVNGKVEVSRVSADGSFAHILEMVLSNIEETSNELHQVAQSITSMQSALDELRGAEEVLKHNARLHQREQRVLTKELPRV